MPSLFDSLTVELPSITALPSLPELLADFEQRGITLSADPAGVRVSPVRWLSPADREAVKFHKPVILTVLAFRDALEARTLTGDNGATVRWDKELSRLFKEARAAVAPDILSRDTGAVYPGYPSEFRGCLPDQEAHRGCSCEKCLENAVPNLRLL